MLFKLEQRDKDRALEEAASTIFPRKPYQYYHTVYRALVGTGTRLRGGASQPRLNFDSSACARIRLAGHDVRPRC